MVPVPAAPFLPVFKSLTSEKEVPSYCSVSVLVCDPPTTNAAVCIPRPAAIASLAVFKELVVAHAPTEVTAFHSSVAAVRALGPNPPPAKADVFPVPDCAT